MPPETPQSDGQLNKENLQDELDKVKSEQKGQGKQLTWIRIAIGAILLIAVVGFLQVSATMYGVVQSELQTKAAAFQTLYGQVSEQNTKVDSLLDELKEIKQIQIQILTQ